MGRRYKDRHGKRIQCGDAVLQAVTINQDKWPNSTTVRVVKKKGRCLVLDGVWGWSYLKDTDPKELVKLTGDIDLRAEEAHFIREYGISCYEIRGDLACKDFDKRIMVHFFKYAVQYFGGRDSDYVKNLQDCIEQFTGMKIDEEQAVGPMESCLKDIQDEIEKMLKNCQVSVHTMDGYHDADFVMVKAFHLRKILQRIKG